MPAGDHERFFLEGDRARGGYFTPLEFNPTCGSIAQQALVDGRVQDIKCYFNLKLESHKLLFVLAAG